MLLLLLLLYYIIKGLSIGCAQRSYQTIIFHFETRIKTNFPEETQPTMVGGRLEVSNRTITYKYNVPIIVVTKFIH